MKSDKLKPSLSNLIMNYLTGDYLSWQFLYLPHFEQRQSRETDANKRNPLTKKGRKMALETHARAWVKSLVWRAVGIGLLGFISWTITHNWKEMTTITVLFHGIRVILYYFHERLWEKVSWGRVKHPLSVLPVKRELEPEDLKIIQGQLRQLGYLD